MNEEKYVCHISGQGEKYEVRSETQETWHIWRGQSNPDYYLPKSEYRLCDPPEVWRDVTDGVVEKETQNVCWWYWMHGEEEAVACHISKGYRLRKVQLDQQFMDDPKWAFIVEQKVQP